MPATLDLETISILLVWTAIAIYALAFIAYSVDLAKRSALAIDSKDLALAKVPVPVGAPDDSVRDAAEPVQTSTPEPPTNTVKARFMWARIGTSLTVLGFLFQLAGDVTRGIASGRVPWSNMYEFALTGTLLIVAVYLGVLFRYELRFLGAFITGLVVLLLGGSAIAFYVVVTPLPDQLKSVWLVVHVFVASLGTALFALAFGLSVLQLFLDRRERRGKTWMGFLRTLPEASTLESLAYRFSISGFMFWTFTLIAGSIWANDAWGRYWAFDTKEVWTFVIWVLYAGYIHARATRGWRGNRSAWLSIIGFSAVLFNFVIVNVYFRGLHAYSGLS